MPGLVYPAPSLPDGRKAQISSHFSWTKGPGKRKHLGVDIDFKRLHHAAPGADDPADPYDDQAPFAFQQGSKGYFVPPDWPCLATEDGLVTRVGYLSDSPFRGRIRLLHRERPEIDGGNSTVYIHIADILVSEGERVIAGQRIGTIGPGPRSLPHIHFERHKRATEKSTGRVIEPYDYLRSCEHVMVGYRPARQPPLSTTSQARWLWNDWAALALAAVPLYELGKLGVRWWRERIT